MSEKYRAIGWNPQKRRYDVVLAAGVIAYLVLFIGVSAVLHPNATIETLIIRATATGALLLLHVILCIGPLARLDSRFLPLLYNRRHLGVTMFLLALVHGVFSTLQFHALGDLHPLVSIFVGNPRYDSVSQFPFQPFGLLALVILLFMAATSHDFWLKNLSAPTWKALHMGVYVAYVSVVLHVALGALQSETDPVLGAVVLLGVLVVLVLHWLAGGREQAGDRELPLGDDGLVRVCAASEIPEGRAHVAAIAGERVAIFRHGDRLSAISNVCQHQNGPLGEGRIIDGCVVCPWHGFQYRPEDGCAPAPFEEKIPTFNLVVRDGQVLIDPTPNPPGTRVEPVAVPALA